MRSGKFIKILLVNLAVVTVLWVAWSIFATKPVERLDADGTALFYDILDQAGEEDLAYFVEKLIPVKGIVTQIGTKEGRFTLYLKQSETDIGLLCEFEPGNEAVYNSIQVGDSLNILGVYKGKLMDAIFQNCVIN